MKKILFDCKSTASSGNKCLTGGKKCPKLGNYVFSFSNWPIRCSIFQFLYINSVMPDIDA